MTDRMIERVARTIYLIENVGPPFLDDPEGDVGRDWPNYVPEALAVLAIMREPTEAMVRAGEAHTDTYYSKDGDFALGWSAAIDAALTEQ